MGQSRILLAMSRDGLLPASFFANIHPVYNTPYKSQALIGIIVALIAGFVPLSVLVELVSIGTLLAFTIVCIGVLVLRRTAPHLKRPFRCPWVPFIPLAGAFTCIWLMLSLPSSNWIRLVIWLAIGLAIYILYGKKEAARVQEERKRKKQEIELQRSLEPQPTESNEQAIDETIAVDRKSSLETDLLNHEKNQHVSKQPVTDSLVKDDTTSKPEHYTYDMDHTIVHTSEEHELEEKHHHQKDTVHKALLSDDDIPSDL